MTGKNLLFLAHRIPYPPNKGDKIRSFNLLKFLAASYRVHLGAFVDDPEDWRHAAELQRYCAELCLLPLHPARARLRSLRGFLTGGPLSAAYYGDYRMAAWIRELLKRQPIHGILVFSSAMAQYVDHPVAVPRIIDFVDVDSDKWRQYAARKPWPARWIYRREAERLWAFDRRIASGFDRALFVSRHEAGLFARLAPELSERVVAIENGVDTAYFDRAGVYPNPYPPDVNAMVFTGAMDYWANVDAVIWFADAVFPEVRRQCPAAVFYVVGARPTAAVRALGRRAGVVVTGAVPDVRPYLRHARCAVAPLRIARGVQNKVLEAMAMGKPVLASPAALEGIEAESWLEALDLRIAEQAADWRELGLAMLGDGGLSRESASNRAFVVERYGWPASLARLGRLLDTLCARAPLP